MSSKPTYRPDIDGLRAIAIILVLIFHSGFSLFPGGYIGVDVFFVISGFLITSIIEKEIKENIFSFKNFYLRRIRRIIPVLIFIMLIITILCCFILFSNNLEAFSRTLLYTFLCANNFHLYFNSGDYFAENSDLIPFLHTWSLSVEEQFYFLLPPVLIVLHQKFNSKKRFAILMTLCVVGVFFSVYQSYTNPRMAYFLLPARLFELLIGSCLALYWEKVPNLNTLQNHILSIVGIFLILIPAVVLDNSSIFPGLNALWPCLGTALLLLSGKTEAAKGIVNKLIQNKLMVGIGLISYSLYLWHWPIFVLIKYTGISLEGWIRITAILTTFLLSYLSWKYIEQPFRTTLKFDFKKTISIIFVPALVLVGLIYGILDAKDGFPERHPELAEFNPKKNYPNKLRGQCFDKFKVGNCKECFIGIEKDSLDGMLIGDSFANHTAAFLDVLAKDAGLYIHDSAAGGYPVMNNVDRKGIEAHAEDYAIERINYAKKFKTIYIAANWEGLSEPKNAQTYHSTLQSLAELVKSGKKIIIFEALRKTTALNLHRAKLVKAKIPVYFSEKDFSIAEYKRPNDYIIDEIKRKFPSIMIIDLNQLMCENGKCDIELNNTIVYRNEDHLNTSGARLLGELYLKKYGNPLRNLK